MISCSEAINQLWTYLDHTVNATERALVQEHLDRCRRCCGELEFAKELRGKLADSASVELPDEVARRLHQTLDQLGR